MIFPLRDPRSGCQQLAHVSKRERLRFIFYGVRIILLRVAYKGPFRKDVVRDGRRNGFRYRVVFIESEIFRVVCMWGNINKMSFGDEDRERVAIFIFNVFLRCDHDCFGVI